MQDYITLINKMALDFEKEFSKEIVEKALKRYLLSKSRADLNYEMYWYNKARRL